MRNKNYSAGDVVSFGGIPGMLKVVVYLREQLKCGGLSIFAGRALGRRSIPIYEKPRLVVSTKESVTS